MKLYWFSRATVRKDAQSKAFRTGTVNSSCFSRTRMGKIASEPSTEFIFLKSYIPIIPWSIIRRITVRPRYIFLKSYISTTDPGLAGHRFWPGPDRFLADVDDAKNESGRRSRGAHVSHEVRHAGDQYRRRRPVLILDTIDAGRKPLVLRSQPFPAEIPPASTP